MYQGSQRSQAPGLSPLCPPFVSQGSGYQWFQAQGLLLFCPQFVSQGSQALGLPPFCPSVLGRVVSILCLGLLSTRLSGSL